MRKGEREIGGEKGGREGERGKGESVRHEREMEEGDMEGER